MVISQADMIRGNYNFVFLILLYEQASFPKAVFQWKCGIVDQSCRAASKYALMQIDSDEEEKNMKKMAVLKV